MITQNEDTLEESVGDFIKLMNLLAQVDESIYGLLELWYQKPDETIQQATLKSMLDKAKEIKTEITDAVSTFKYYESAEGRDYFAERIERKKAEERLDEIIDKYGQDIVEKFTKTHS